MKLLRTNKFKNLFLAALVSLTLVGGIETAHASLYSWGLTPTVTGSRDIITDVLGAAPLSGQKITAAWSAYDSGYYYFRIDLASAPTSTNFAGIYGIYIDSAAGGIPDTGGVARIYAPKTSAGLEANYDYILDSHYQPYAAPNGFYQHDFHIWNGTDLVLGSVPTTEQNGATLEWKIAASDLGNPGSFTWTAAAIDSGSFTTTYTMTTPTDATPTPIPAAAWLLGYGLMGLAGIRRRKQN